MGDEEHLLVCCILKFIKNSTKYELKTNSESYSL